MIKVAGVVVLVLGLVAACSAAADPGEPSEREMRQALEAQFRQVNAQYRALGEKCERREFRNDPLMAMQCLQLCGAGGGKCSMAFRITGFEKIGCGKAVGQAGFMCDFVLGFTSNSPFARGAMNQLTGGGDTAKGRFIRRDDGWLFLPRR